MGTSKKILVVGDFVEDVYTYVGSTRNCPEAPVPVYDVVRHDSFLGCAGNVVLNLAALAGGESVRAFGPMSDSVEDVLDERLGPSNVYPYVTGGGIVKQRIVHDGRIVCRVDNARWSGGLVSMALLQRELRDADAVVISDYGFGALTDDVVSLLMSSGVRVFVDSKRKDMSVFRGATVFKLNESEWAEQISICARGPELYVESLCGFCVVTKGSRGYEVRVRTAAPRGGYSTDSLSFPAYTSGPVVDVTGCGDTFLAALVYSMVCRGTDVFMGCRFANRVASRAVHAMGPYVPDDEQARGMIDKFFGTEEEDEARP